MERLVVTLIVALKLSFFVILVSATPKTVDIIKSSNLNGLKDEEILEVLSQNKTGISDNFTLAELIDHIGNNTVNEVWRRNDENDTDSYTNSFYAQFTEEIDRESRHLLDFVPAYQPGTGPVSAECRRESEIFKQELQKFSLWALKMFDATAKIPSGILNGNVNQFGDFDECMGVQGNEGIQGQYCLAYLKLDIDESRPDLKHIHKLLHAHYAFKSNLTDPGHRVPRFGTVNWAVCTPASCSPQDVEASLRHTLAKHTARTGLKITVKVDAEMCQKKVKESYPTETKIASAFFLGVIALAMLATVYDHLGLVASEYLLSFSLKKNFKKLVSLERGEGDIAALHGVRALNAMMLIIAHKSMALFFNPYVNRTEMTEYLGKPWTVIGRAASLYTDPFIMLSGLLTTYSFIGRLNRTGKLDVKSEYLSRLLRLVPTLGALVLFCTYVMPFMGSGPQWNLVVTHHADICKKTWWRNFLFIHNYFGFENMCLTHTHHLGIDTQLFAVSPVIVLLLWKKPKFGAFLLASLAVFSTILRYNVTYDRQLNNYVFFGTSIKQLFDTANHSYILPTHRLTVYIIGIFTGYLLRNFPKNYKLNPVFIKAGWVVSTLMFIGAFVGPATMGSINYVYNPTHAAIYNAFSPIGWCILFAWMAFLSHTGNSNGILTRMFAWRGFLICTRLSYAIYLTQFPVFFYNVGMTRSAEYYGFLRMMLNIRELIWIVVTSIILTLLFDTPFQNIKNYLLRKSKASAIESSQNEKSKGE
ncbi:nose resistant to fluoxetine protein 6-like isoform X2 [Athalia rosae]|uniref:nose resistant to fluoxetine protein 6-like isoform X2 n=1 Tax=Athalia rosae TaxID=37344 RepID=UPI002033C7DA|nr:nose resistant to fluoxetine protein 6-like isoform X2 [Athalia rosae]